MVTCHCISSKRRTQPGKTVHLAGFSCPQPLCRKTRAQLPHPLCQEPPSRLPSLSEDLANLGKMVYSSDSSAGAHLCLPRSYVGFVFCFVSSWLLFGGMCALWSVPFLEVFRGAVRRKSRSNGFQVGASEAKPTQEPWLSNFL